MQLRLLALLCGAGLTMGATVQPASAGISFSVHDAASSRVLARIAAATGLADAETTVRRLVQQTTSDTVFAPADVASWWTRLSSSARDLLVAAVPEFIGDLNGLPYHIRDEANRAVLAAAIRDLNRAIPSAGKGEAQFLSSRLTMLEQVRTALAAGSGPVRLLVTLDTTGSGRAAISVGDPDTAKYVNYLVPGMYFSVRDQIVDWTTTAAHVQAEQASWLKRFNEAATTAVISWIGYQTPTALSVIGVGDAEQGAVKLAAEVNGLKAARRGSEPFLAVLAHSYGATATLLALQAHAFSVDALAMVGAPGSPAQSVKQLAVPSGAVYVGRDNWDPVATSGFFGSDPTAASYGATALGTSGGVDPISHAVLTAAVGHNGYFDVGTESLRNIALVGIGRGSDVTNGTSGRSGELALAK